MDAVDARFLQDPHMSDGGALRSSSRLSHTSEASLGELADTSALEASASPTWSPTHHALDGTRRRRAAAAATAAAVAAATSDTSPPQPKPKPRLMQSHSQSQLLSTSPPQRQAKAGRRSRGSSAARLRSSAAATTTGGDSARRGRVDSFDIGPEEERTAPRPRRSRRRKGGRGSSAARSRAATTAADGGSGGAATSTAATTTTAATTGSASTGDGLTNGISSRAPSTRASPRSGRRSRNRRGGSTTATSERPSRRQSRRHAAGHSDATSDSNGESGVEYVPQQFGLAGSSSRSLLEGIGTATGTGAAAGGGNATSAGNRTRTSSSDMGGVGRSRHSTSTRGEDATDESMESSTGSLQLKPPLSSRQTTSRRASRSSRASSATRKRLRLKCHYKGHIRVVAVSDRSSFRTLLARLAEDYSFEVSLRFNQHPQQHTSPVQHRPAPTSNHSRLFVHNHCAIGMRMQTATSLRSPPRMTSTSCWSTKLAPSWCTFPRQLAAWTCHGYWHRQHPLPVVRACTCTRSTRLPNGVLQRTKLRKWPEGLPHQAPRRALAARRDTCTSCPLPARRHGARFGTNVAR